MASVSSAERVIGTILGGALGDACGGPHEGTVDHLHAAVPDRLAVSDDTQLTLATCEAVIETGRVRPADIAARFLVWFREGRLSGLGASTLKAMGDLDAGAHWALAGARGERAAGNGAAMRVAPLAFLLDPEDDADRRLVRDVCRITHHNDEAYVGALAVLLAVHHVSRPDYAPANVVGDVAALLPDSQVRDRLLRFSACEGDPSPADLGAAWGRSGFVADSVPLAIFAAREIGARPFAEVIVRAIQAGGDTDTIASIAGQIAGAAVGGSSLPAILVGRLVDGTAIFRTARDFARLATSAR